METIVSGKGYEVVVSPEHPTRIIGERINPTGRKGLARKLTEGEIEVVQAEALQQVEEGADIIDVNVGAAGVEQVEVLPRAVQLVQEVYDGPVAIDTPDHDALEEALKIYEGKALVNSVNGEEKNLKRVLPLVAEYGAAVIGLTMDDDGISNDPQKRLEIAQKIVSRAEDLGIPREDVVIDCLALTVGADPKAAVVTLDSIDLVREELGVNMTLGASNVSFGLPARDVLNKAFLPIAISKGVNVPIVDAAEMKYTFVAVDVLLGRDDFAMNFIKYYRAQQC
jgi:5-methyltetrahydrofolate--homocysteine methyltransferase